MSRWRIDLIAYLGELKTVTERGGSEAYLLRRLEGLAQALKNRLEVARRGA